MNPSRWTGDYRADHMRQRLLFRLTAQAVILTFPTLQIAWAERPISTPIEVLENDLCEKLVGYVEYSSHPEPPRLKLPTDFLIEDFPRHPVIDQTDHESWGGVDEGGVLREIREGDLP